MTIRMRRFLPGGDRSPTLISWRSSLNPARPLRPTMGWLPTAAAVWGRSGTPTLSPPNCSAAVLLLSHRKHPQRLSIAAGFQSPTTHDDERDEKSGIRTNSRRILTLILFPLSVPLSLSSSASPSPPPPIKVDDLEWYTDRTEGFTLLKPSSWIKVEKAGATALFEEGKKGSNNIGIVVNPVRLSSLRDFGTPEFVADKLIQAERRKESTKQAEVIAVAERLGHGGLPVYEFEYTVDSTRGGMKRIFSAAFVASKKLYLLNIAYMDRPENPLDSQTRTVLEQVLHSFDTAV